MKLGKPDRPLMAETIFRLTGTKNPAVAVGPGPGVDTSVLGMGNSRVLIASSDPVSFIPSIGAERSALLSVHGIASDVATSGVAPKYALFDLNLPPSLSNALLRRYWKSVHNCCRELGISILGGHTGRFQGCGYTIIGGATMFAVGKRNHYVTSNMALAGDDILATKGAAIESAAVLARCFPETVKKHLGREILARSLDLIAEVSTVRDSLIASSVGLGKNGVTAMHDVTEGGVLSAIVEMADASRLGASVELESIPVSEEVREVCRLFGIDPYTSLGQGSLIVASRPDHTKTILRALQRNQILASVVGKLAKTRRRVVVLENGTKRALHYPKEDPYWRAYWRGIRKHLT